jgi:hypothetical protein
MTFGCFWALSHAEGDRGYCSSYALILVARWRFE